MKIMQGDFSPANGDDMAKNRLGKVYLLHYPEYSPARVKIGFTSHGNVEDRFKKVRPFVPDIEIVKDWPARQRWEPQARLAITNVPGVTRVGNSEVFRLQPDVEIGQLISQGDGWFSLMPSPETDSDDDLPF